VVLGDRHTVCALDVWRKAADLAFPGAPTGIGRPAAPTGQTFRRS
jgi:hypothetical protein